MYLACVRAQAAEALANIPSKHQPTSEDLEGYTARYEASDDLAWSDKLTHLLAWLSDYSAAQKQHNKSDNDEQFAGLPTRNGWGR